MLVFAHYSNTRNIGDLACAPYRYFPFPQYKVADVHRPAPLRGRVIVVGGGAVAQHVERAVADDPEAIVVGWGVGDSRHGLRTPREPPPGVALYGSREWGQKGTIHVPCVSCMSPLFDAPPPPSRPYVLFTNAGKRIMDTYPVRIDGMPELRNHTTMEEAVAFLASGETVLTNSYHGAYWGTLLRRRVVIVNPYSSKFHNFRFQPVIATDAGWKDAAERAIVFPQALDEARAANLAFHRRVMSFIETGHDLA